MLSKEDKKIKNWDIHPHFYHKWVQTLTFSWNYWYIKTARVIVLPKCCQNHKVSLLYSICHQVQGHLHLDKSIVPWIESLITTQCVLFCPCVGYLPFWKIKKVWLLFHCKSSIVIRSIYICTLFYFKIEKIKRKDKEIKKIIWFWGKWFTWDSNSRPLLLQASALTTALRKILSWACICPIYRQPIFIINLNTDKTVSMQSELLAFLPTL